MASYRSLLATAALVALLSSGSARVMEYEALPYDSVADPSAVVVRGLTRFTVLTDRLVRMEQSKQGCTCGADAPCQNLNDGSCSQRIDPTGHPVPQGGQCSAGTSDCEVGHFEDRPTLAMVNRKMATVPKFTVKDTNTTVTIATAGGVTVTYALGKPFAADTLSATFGEGGKSTWHFGQRNDGNLLGTIKSLDGLGPISLNCTENNSTRIHEESLHCEWGLVSRDGWSVYDDTQNYCLGDGDWWDGSDSTAARNRDGADLYGFFHGTDYKGALADFTQVGGRAALATRAGLSGVWWTRWFDFNDADARAIVDTYRARSFPLDVFVLDMDWHRKNSWTGYSFDNTLFPDEDAFMAALHDDGLQMAANLHDDVGIGPWENDYEYMRALMGTPNGTNVPFTMCTNTTYTNAVEDVVLGGLESSRIGGKLSDGGMDFWWIDWQQGGNHGGCAGAKQNPTIWTNKIRCTDAKRRAAAAARAAGSALTPAAEAAGAVGRNMVLARWGGMGTHRYQVGFSGDVQGLTWPNLAYQPYFTLTSANVGYMYWSHDIEMPAADYEMGARWVQWAAVSPVFRSHERGMSGGGCADTLQQGQARSQCSIVEPWNVPQQYADANRAAMRRRVELTPYTYTAARAAYDTGVGLVRPMYYEHPTLEAAYGATPEGAFSQYYFGDDMVAAPVVVQSAQGSAPAPWRTGMSTTTVFVPPGDWVEEATGVTHTGAADGSTVLTKAYDISETPVFVRAGAVVPTVPLVDGDTLGVAARQYTSLEFTVYPGAASGGTRVYEDDGSTTAYTAGKYAYIEANYTVDGAVLAFTTAMDGTVGAPTDPSVTPATRQTTLRIKSAFPPASVSVNGAEAVHARRLGRAGASPAWTYCHKEMAVIVRAPAQPTASPLSIKVTSSSAAGFAADAKALDGAKGHVAHAILAKASLDATRQTVGAHNPGQGDHLKTLSSTGSKLAYLAAKDAKAFAATVAELPALVKAAADEVSGMQKVSAGRMTYAKGLLSSVVSA